jgi:hypothetical protein
VELGSDGRVRRRRRWRRWRRRSRWRRRWWRRRWRRRWRWRRRRAVSPARAQGNEPESGDPDRPGDACLQPAATAAAPVGAQAQPLPAARPTPALAAATDEDAARRLADSQADGPASSRAQLRPCLEVLARARGHERSRDGSRIRAGRAEQSPRDEQDDEPPRGTAAAAAYRLHALCRRTSGARSSSLA